MDYRLRPFSSPARWTQLLVSPRRIFDQVSETAVRCRLSAFCQRCRTKTAVDDRASGGAPVAAIEYVFSKACYLSCRALAARLVDRAVGRNNGGVPGSLSPIDRRRGT